MSPDSLLRLYRRMVRIRIFEEKVQELHRLGKLPGFVHVYVGEEAVAVGACSVLRDTSLGILGANGIVGGGIPMATGSGIADAVLGRDGVTVCFFGDGAANQGVLLEALNLAAIWKLPVVYLCESNQYMEFSPTTDLTAGRICRRGEPFGVASMEVDGNDVLEVRRVVGEAVDRARRGEGPTLIEAITYRLSGHSEGESAFVSAYRTEDEVASWKARDPITRFRDLLQTGAGISAARLDSIDAEEQEAVNEAVVFAESSPFPSPDEALDHVFAPAGG